MIGLACPLLRVLLVVALVLVGLAPFVAAGTLPAPLVPVILPPAAANAFGVSVTFGANDGLMYVWDGASVLKENGVNDSSFTSIGSVGSGSADAGPIAFSRDGSRLLVGNGLGGAIGGPTHDGKIFSIPSAGGSSSTPVGTIAFHNAFVAAPLGASQTSYFVDSGADKFGTASRVSVFDQSTGNDVSVIQPIPGASSSIALDAADNLYVGIGFGAQAGEIRMFSLAALTNAFNTSTPLAWSAGSVFNLLSNNSGAGMFLDSRGYLFAGGGDGVTVFDPLGHSRVYDNGGYSIVTYDPANDRVLVTGFGNEQGTYPASMFVVPEPAGSVLAVSAAWILVPFVRRHRRRPMITFGSWRTFSPERGQPPIRLVLSARD
jgi:hypothetical protein